MSMTWQTQPYRGAARRPTFALQAMLNGRPQFMPNPMDAQRAAQKRRKPDFGALYALLMAQAQR